MTSTPTAVTGANVRAEMARRGVSQTTLAAVLGVTQPQVSARLRGIVPFNVNELHAVAAFLDVSVGDLLDGVAA